MDEVSVAPIPVIRGDLDGEEFVILCKRLGRGMGDKSLTIMFNGELSTFTRLFHTEIPAEYLEGADPLEA
jgi:hypothetical protein